MSPRSGQLVERASRASVAEARWGSSEGNRAHYFKQITPLLSLSFCHLTDKKGEMSLSRFRNSIPVVHVDDAHAACLRWSQPVSLVTGMDALHNSGGIEGDFLLWSVFSLSHSRLKHGRPFCPWKSALSIKTHLVTFWLTAEPVFSCSASLQHLLTCAKLQSHHHQQRMSEHVHLFKLLIVIRHRLFFVYVKTQHILKKNPMVNEAVERLSLISPTANK